MQVKKFRPMRAAKLTKPENLRFPLLASIKEDGVRCSLRDGKALTKSLHLVPNLHVQRLLREAWEGAELRGASVDGELVIPGLDYNSIQSQIMSRGGEPAFEFRLFDRVPQEGSKVDWSMGFNDRLGWLRREVCFHPEGEGFLREIQQRWIHNMEELLAFEQEAVDAGREGLMLRSPDGIYKCGDATEREQYVIKMKRFYDSEARIVGWKERMRNTNEAKVNALGHKERSSAKEGLVPAGDLGSWIVEETINGVVVQFDVGSGLTARQRVDYWAIKEQKIGDLVKYKFQELTKYGVPRLPIFLGDRDKRDMS